MAQDEVPAADLRLGVLPLLAQVRSLRGALHHGRLRGPLHHPVHRRQHHVHGLRPL